ncbi:MAG: NADH-quinone oxidoreductase subunit M [Actinobacteria bacterium]|nr:NADH-quinone oxidoreductase subunit M [Actinomycetota bacterium]
MDWLSLTIFLPLVGVPILLFSKMSDRSARVFTLSLTILTFLVSLGILVDFDPSNGGMQLVTDVSWVEQLHLRYIVGVDGISIWMVLLSTLMMPLAILASWKINKRVRYYMAAMLFLEMAMVGSFLILDLLLFFIFFEGMLFPMYLLIGEWGGERRVYAAVKFFLYTMAGSALLLVAILFLYSHAANVTGTPTFDLRVLSEIPIAASTGRWLFLAFFLAFAVKVPLFPLHTWLPDAHTEAPTAGSVILAAILLKIGTYGIIRFNLGLFPEASHHFADFIQILAAIGIVYGALVAMMQPDIKRLVAYSSVSHLGFVVIGIFAFTSMGMSGGIMQMINHGLSTGGLFLCIGMLYERTHTRRLDEMGGLAKTMPKLTGVFLVVVLSSIGLPGLNNFVGEFMVIIGTFVENNIYGAIAATGALLAAIYLLWPFQRIFYGPLNQAHAHHPDMSKREWTYMAPVLGLMLVVGLFPNLMLDSINPSVDLVLERVQPAEVRVVKVEVIRPGGVLAPEEGTSEEAGAIEGGSTEGTTGEVAP